MFTFQFICRNEERGLLEGSKNFTVLIKNAIQFPKFGKQYNRRNILENSNKTYLQKCIYNPETDPFCPVFRLGDVVEDAGENYTEVAVRVSYSKINLCRHENVHNLYLFQGGVFVITISWFCDLDFDFLEFCKPKYSFQRMDNPEAVISPGWNFRYV